MKQRARLVPIGIGVVTETPRPDMIYHYHIQLNSKTCPVIEMNNDMYDFYIEEYKSEYVVKLEMTGVDVTETVAKFNRDMSKINQKPFTYEEVTDWLRNNATGLMFFYWRDYICEGGKYNEYE